MGKKLYILIGVVGIALVLAVFFPLMYIVVRDTRELVQRDETKTNQAKYDRLQPPPSLTPIPTPTAASMQLRTPTPMPTPTPYSAAAAAEDREAFRENYQAIIRMEYSHLNNINVKLERSGHGYNLLAYHSMFTSSTFDIGSEAKDVQLWVSDNADELLACGITHVGVASTGGLGGQTITVQRTSNP